MRDEEKWMNKILRFDTFNIFHRKFHQGVATFEAKFFAYVEAVLFDGADSHKEFAGDFFVGFVAGDEPQDFDFGRS